MMHCISVNYRKTPLSMRENLSFSLDDKERFEKEVIKLTGEGCVIISTCNRTEIYVTGKKENIFHVEELWSIRKKVRLHDLKKHRYLYSKDTAIRHLCEVSSGIDSMVVGEDEILRQVKEGYHQSLQQGNTDPELNIIFQGAIGTAKVVKTDTKLSTTPVSIGTLAVKEILKFLPEKKGNILIIGLSGRMGSILGKNLIDIDIKRGKSIEEDQKEPGYFGFHIVGTSRTERNSLGFIKIIPYEERYQYISWADVIISATTSPHYTLIREDVEELLYKNPKKRLWIDLAVPSDLDPSIRELEQVQWMDIDDFQRFASMNNQEKEREVEKAVVLIEERVEDIRKSLSMQKVQQKLKDIETMVQNKGFPYIVHQLKEQMSADGFEAFSSGLVQIMGEDVE